MRKTFMLMLLAVITVSASAQEYDWRHVQMDGSRTGCISPSKDNVEEALGRFKGGKYIAPDGTVHRRNSATAKTARIVLAAQTKMARVKNVIAYSTEEMVVSYPESSLTNWFVDILMAKVEKLAGKKVDIGVVNFGGIRVDMPKGNVILDDMLSMFPFKNQLAYVELSGKQIRNILESMAARRFQVLGGVRVVADDGKLISAEIGGEPLQDDKIYGMATISFLLDGGDGLTLGHEARSVTIFEEVDVIDAILEHVHAETAAGRPIEYKTDGRVQIKNFKSKKL